MVTCSLPSVVRAVHAFIVVIDRQQHEAMGDVADLTAKAYEIARMIPYGMVTSYGECNLRSSKVFLRGNTQADCMSRTHSETRWIPELLKASSTSCVHLMLFDTRRQTRR